MKTIGGSLFVHNGIEFDYCFREAISSLCGICDEVSVVDAESTDGTDDELRSLAKKFNNLRITTGMRWECAPNFHRLSMLANAAASHLRTDWHFMLQADEVLHESSYPHILRAINEGDYESFMVRRYNLFGDLDHCFRVDIAQDKKPCGDTIIRLAKRRFIAYDDSESLQVLAETIDDSEHLDKIAIIHYGMVRRDANLISKVHSMQGWFYGPGGPEDQRISGMRDSGSKRFAWEEFCSKSDLMPLPTSHPSVAREWVNERRKEKPSITSISG